MDGISRSREWDKEIPHGVLPMEQLVLSDKWARKFYPISECFLIIRIQSVILGNPGVTHSVPTAFITNAVGTEWVTSGLFFV